MLENILTIVTSYKCAACRSMKGISNGNIFTDPDEDKRLYPIIDDVYWDKEFFYELLKSGKTAVQEIIFKTTSSTRSEIMTLVEYYLENDEVRVNKYSNEGGIVSLEKDFDKMYKKSESWNDLLNRRIPEYITGYVYYFPGFIVSTVDEWKKAIKHKLPYFKAYSMGCYHLPHAGGWLLSRDDKHTKNMRPANPLEKMQKIENGDIKLDSIPENEKDEIFNVMPSIGDCNDEWSNHRQIDGERPFSTGKNTNLVPDDIGIYFA